MPARKKNQLRPTTIEPAASAAPGSVIITAGHTRVLCTASVSTQPPPWIPKDEQGKPEHGWVTAEYAMLPGSTPERKKRGPDARATEIQRLIARCLRAAVDMKSIPGLVVTCDCDVLVADGGTRTASITGAYVALVQALRAAVAQGQLPRMPALTPIAAVSVGMVEGEPVLDLDYALDARAEVDLNVAMDGRGRYVELQGTAERRAFTRGQLDAMLALATAGVRKLHALQRKALA